MSDPTTADLLARRAEADARRWEQAAVEMERQRNLALQRAVEADQRTTEALKRIGDQARAMIAALDTLAAKLAEDFEVELPTRGCMEDDERW